MNEKTLNVTLISRHDTEANWKTSSYVPEKGEVVIYDIDSTYNYERFKIGDGKKVVDSLPFAIDAAVPAWSRAANKPSYNLSEVSDTSSYVKMTPAERTKLSGIATGAEVNVQSDWNQTTTTADDYIKNKPTLGSLAGKSVASKTDLENSVQTSLNRAEAAYTHSTSTHARTDATKVEDSATNGNIKINGAETNVYTLPSAGENTLGGAKIWKNGTILYIKTT